MQSSTIKFLQATILVLILLLAPAAFAQVNSASLTGQVTDATGAAVPKAAVTAQNVATNLTRTTTTNDEGIYLISPLPPGQYSLKVEAPGFRSYAQSGIVLTVSLATTQNVVLQVGEQKEVVTVEANAEMINTTSSELGTVVNQTTVAELPLNGRDPSSLVFLSPGVTNVLNSNGSLQAGFSFPTETGGSTNGGRQGSTYYLLDGVPNMDNYLGLTAPFPNADGTQEFRVITNNFDARFGFAPGAVVSIETKSGSNRFHGGVFEFYRDSSLNAANPFSGSVDPLHRNQFGGYIGGPIVKDKIFFFANYQGTRSASASTANHVYTPTAAMLSGDFSGICHDSNNNPIACTSETLAAPFGPAGGKFNQIDPALFNADSVAIATTGLPVGQAIDGGVYYAGGSTINNFDEGTGRLDYDISKNQRVSLRSFINYFKQPSGAVNGNILSLLNLNPWAMVMGVNMEYYNEVLSHTWTVNPTTVNTLSVFWTQMSAHNGAATNDSSGQPMCFSRYINVTELGCYIEGFNVNGSFGTGWTEPSQEVRTTYGLYDTFTKSLNRHVLSFGVNLQHQFAEELTQYPTQPILTFGNSFTGNSLADFLLGDLQQYQQGAGEIAPVSGWQPGFFVQDQYKLRPNLTLTAGLRWDPNIPPVIVGGHGAAFHPGQQSVMFPNAPTGLVFPGDSGVSDTLMPTTYRYLEPRLGVAWQPSFLPKTSIRAGFGMFTSPLMYSMYNHTVDVAPFSPFYNFSATGGVPIPFSDPWSYFPGTGGVSPFPPFASISYKPASSTTFTTPLSIPAIFSNDFHLGVTQSWNLSVEHEFGMHILARAAYVGSESYHLSTMIDQNPGIYVDGGNRTTYPNFGQILTDFSNGTASYNALQLTLEKRMSHGLQFQSNFTWSKAIDDTSSGNISFGNNSIPNPFSVAYSRGISDLNFPYIWVSNLVYTTPSLSNKNHLIRHVLGGWQLSAIYTLQAGRPFGINSGSNNNSGAQQYLDRADLVSGQSLDVQQGSKSEWLNHYFNTGAFQNNAPGTFGNSGRNFLRGPHLNNADLALVKNWTFGESYKLQFRWEMFNALNIMNYGTPGNTVGWGNFGQIQSLAAGAAPRVMQAGLKFAF